MSAIVVVVIEGVLTDIQATLPTADPHFGGLRLVATLNSTWPIAYITTSASLETASVWLQEAQAPSGVFTIAAPLESAADAILGALGKRQDRCALYVSGLRHGFNLLHEHGVGTLHYSHENFVQGDWMMQSTWQNPIEVVPPTEPWTGGRR